MAYPEKSPHHAAAAGVSLSLIQQNVDSLPHLNSDGHFEKPQKAETV